MSILDPGEVPLDALRDVAEAGDDFATRMAALREEADAAPAPRAVVQPPGLLPGNGPVHRGRGDFARMSLAVAAVNREATHVRKRWIEQVRRALHEDR